VKSPTCCAPNSGLHAELASEWFVEVGDHWSLDVKRMCQFAPPLEVIGLAHAMCASIDSQRMRQVQRTVFLLATELAPKQPAAASRIGSASRADDSNSFRARALPLRQRVRASCAGHQSRAQFLVVRDANRRVSEGDRSGEHRAIGFGRDARRSELGLVIHGAVGGIISIG